MHRGRLSLLALPFLILGCADAALEAPGPADAGLVDGSSTDRGMDPEPAPQPAPLQPEAAEPEPQAEQPEPTPPAPDPAPPAPPEPAPPEPAPPPRAGCGQPLTPGVSDQRFTHDGPRRYRLKIPAGYDPARPTPVVLDFHGRHGTAETQALLSGLDAVADAEGFIVVQPQGEGGDSTWNAGFCCGGAQTNGVDDVGATAALLDHLETVACVDPTRIHATGISNGAFMAHRLACDLADRIAGIAPVAGGNLMLVCTPSRPVPVIHFHGTGDAIVPYTGFAGFASIPDSTAGWVTRNGCDPVGQVVFEESDVRCERWTGCAGGASVQLCTIEDGGHTWPGGPDIPGLGRTTRTISASRMLWDYFDALR